MVNEVEIELESDYGGFVLEGMVPALRTKPMIDANTLLRWWPDTDPELSGFFVSGGSQWGPFAVTVRLLDSDPGQPDARWEDVVEFSVDSSGEVLVNDVVDGPAGSLVIPAAAYRVRLGAVGRTESYDRSTEFPEDEDEDEQEDEEPLEHFLIELWVAPATTSAVLRQQSRLARDLLDPPEPTWPTEREAGLAAAWAIVRDVRGEPGGRPIPGDLVSLSIELDLEGAPTRLFNRLRHAFAWPPCHGGSGASDVVGRTAYHDATLPEFDGSYDSAGHIAITLLEEEKPRRVVLGWNWVPEVEASPEQPFPLPARPRLLAKDSTVTMTFVPHDAAGEDPRCIVRVAHADVPAVWASDLRDLWTWHLTIQADR